MGAYRRITVSQRSGVGIVRFADTKITDPVRIDEISRELTQLVDTEGLSRILVNFDKVDYLSSEALRVFLLLQKKMQSRGGMLKLCNVAPEISQVFEITGLNKLFDIRPTEVDALGEF